MAEWIPAKQVFADTVSDLMCEMGLDAEHYAISELKTTIAECTAEYDMCWAELMQWVEYGDDEKAKTMNVIRTALKVARMW